MMPKQELAPKPDRQTGEPRPPEAPTVTTGTYKPQPWNPRKVPQPPEGEGPPIEWCYGDARSTMWTVGILGILVAGFLVVYISLSAPGPYPLTGSSLIWLVLLVGALVIGIAFLSNRDKVSAGAEWLMDGKQFVRTYELTSVTWEKDTDHGELHLEDAHGSRTDIHIRSVEVNRRLWDLAYNGIRHSVANGANVDGNAARRLRLHDILEWRDHSA